MVRWAENFVRASGRRRRRRWRLSASLTPKGIVKQTLGIKLDLEPDQEDGQRALTIGGFTDQIVLRIGCVSTVRGAPDDGGEMAEIKDWHVEWRVVDRLRELLENLPDTKHEVTLTHALFTSTLCWTCERLRDERNAGFHRDLWLELDQENVNHMPWSIDQLRPQMYEAGTSDLATLPASWFLVGLRNSVAHGDHRNVLPYHTFGRGADRELRGFQVVTSFKHTETIDRRKIVVRNWGKWTIILTRAEMRRIGLLISHRFVNTLSLDDQADARQHVKAA